MFTNCSCARLAQYQFRCLSTAQNLHKSRSSHYDSLGITPKATQADVKSAYYGLSKIYHPDRNEGCQEASQKFRDITEAYEVLGNVKTRKLYDKGMSIGTNLGATNSSRERPNPFYEHREKRTRPSPSGGRQPIYDFDEWSRMHYGATFARDMEIKRRNKMMAERELEFQQSDRMEKVLLVVGILMAFCMYSIWGHDDYDDVQFVGDASVKVTED